MSLMVLKIQRIGAWVDAVGGALKLLTILAESRIDRKRFMKSLYIESVKTRNWVVCRIDL